MARELRLPDVPEPLWRRLRDDGYDLNAADGSPEALRDLVSAALREWKLVQDLGDWGTEKTKRLPGREHYAGEVRMGEAVSALMLSEELGEDYSTKMFRRQLGGILSPEQAIRFLSSPLVRLFPRQVIGLWGIPMAEHAATIIRKNLMLPEYYEIELFVDPPGITMQMTIPYGRGFRLVNHPGESEPVVLGPESFPAPRPYLARAERLTSAELDFWPSSALAEVRDVAAAQARTTGWDLSETVWAILTDELPSLDPMVAIVSRASAKPSTITLTVWPSVSSKSVEAFYRETRRAYFRQSLRSPGPRNLDVFQFVLRERKVGGEKLSWRELMSRWNGEHPKMRYGYVRNFFRDYSRTERLVRRVMLGLNSL